MKKKSVRKSIKYDTLTTIFSLLDSVQECAKSTQDFAHSN